MQWKGVYSYYLLIGITLLALIISPDTMEVPTWGTLLGVLFLVWVGTDQSWKAFKRQGRAAILVSLKPAEGGHSTIHPDDISIVMSNNDPGEKSSPSFCVFVTGGFVHGGIEWQGQENFVVCPPEHIESTGPAFICHTNLRRVDFSVLPDYIKEELTKMKFFSPLMAKTKHNLWFGMTSKLDGSTTATNLARESKFLDQTYVINSLKSLLKDKAASNENTRQGRKSEQIIVNIPEK